MSLLAAGFIWFGNLFQSLEAASQKYFSPYIAVRLFDHDKRVQEADRSIFTSGSDDLES